MATITASGGLWQHDVFAEKASPQAKAMAAVNAMRLDAFHRQADMLPNTRFQTRIVSFDASVSTRNLALMGVVVAPQTEATS